MPKKNCKCNTGAGEKKKPHRKGQKKLKGGFVSLPDNPNKKPMLGLKKNPFAPKIYW